MSRWFLVLLVSSACSFDPSTEIDPASSPNADETPPTVGASVDAGSSTDANRFEQADEKSDAGLTKPAASCEAIYGAANSYDLCEETPNSCRFYVRTNEDSCTNLCASFGGSCIDNYDGNCASGIGSQGCNIIHADQVCICSKPSASLGTGQG